VLEIVGQEAIEGTVMGQALDLGDPKARRFDERMRQEHGRAYRWPVVAALGYDAGQVMFRAVERAGRPDPLAIRDALETLDGVEDRFRRPGAPLRAGRPRVPGPRARLPGRVAERAGGAARTAVTTAGRRGAGRRHARPAPAGRAAPAMALTNLLQLLAGGMAMGAIYTLTAKGCSSPTSPPSA
jgi:hypothetical protein